MRTVSLLVVCLALCSVSHAAIAAISGPDANIIAAPAKLLDDEELSVGVSAFNERQGVVLPQDVTCDNGVTLPAGITVDSHMVFLNVASGRVNGHADFIFSNSIICTMSDDKGKLEVATSSFLGAPGTQYPASQFTARGLESNDHFEVNGAKLTVDFVVTQPGDWVRVLTQSGEELIATCDESINKPCEPEGTNPMVTLHSAGSCACIRWDENGDQVPCEDLIVCEDQTLHRWVDEDPTATGHKDPAVGGTPERLGATYNEATHEFTFEGTFSSYNGHHANSFWVVFSDSDNPKGDGNELIIFYADWATSQVALYVYSGANNAASWTWSNGHFFGTTPLIKSESGGLRTWAFAVEGALADDVANYSVSGWKGLAFGNNPSRPNEIGVWLHSARNGISFDANGEITGYHPGQETYYDHTGLPTESEVICV